MSRSLAVTSVRPLVTAVAASKPSMTGIGLTALMRPHWSETALSIPNTRPSNAASTCRSHRSSAAALSGSLGRASSTPLRISPRTSVLKKRSSSAIEAYHVETCGLQRSPFRTSEMILVSIRKLTGRRRVRGQGRDLGRSHQAALMPAASSGSRQAVRRSVVEEACARRLGALGRPRLPRHGGPDSHRPSDIDFNPHEASARHPRAVTDE